MKAHRKVLVILGVIALLAAGAAPVLAAGPEAEPAAALPALNGKVREVNPPYLTVATRFGPVLLLTTEDTEFIVPGVEEPTLADIQEGDLVRLRLGQDSEARLLAKVVAVIPASEVRGVVTGKDGASLTVRTGDGEVTLLTDEHTRYRVPEIENPTLADIRVGDVIRAGVVEQEDGSLLAKVIAVVLEPVRFRGRVTHIAGNNVKVETREGEVLLHTDDATRFRVPGVEEPTLEDVHEGDLVAVVALKKGEGSLWARLIAVLPAEAIRGEIAALPGGSIVVSTPDAEITVLVDEETRYRIPGVEEPGYEDLQVGDRVLIGAVEKEGGLLAKAVAVGRPPANESGMPGKELSRMPAQEIG